MSTELRKSARVALDCEIDFKRQGDARYRVGLFDFSPEGCCLAPPRRLEAGDPISVRIPDIAAVQGQVAWVQDWKAGVKFGHPFHPAVFDHVIRRLRGSSAFARSGRARPR